MKIIVMINFLKRLLIILVKNNFYKKNSTENINLIYHFMSNKRKQRFFILSILTSVLLLSRHQFDLNLYNSITHVLQIIFTIIIIQYLLSIIIDQIIIYLYAK